MGKIIKPISKEQLKRKQFKQKLSMLLSVAAHTQNIAGQVTDLADDFMSDADKNSSDVLRVVENLLCVCEDALAVLVEEIKNK